MCFGYQLIRRLLCWIRSIHTLMVSCASTYREGVLLQQMEVDLSNEL